MITAVSQVDYSIEWTNGDGAFKEQFSYDEQGLLAVRKYYSRVLSAVLTAVLPLISSTTLWANSKRQYHVGSCFASP